MEFKEYFFAGIHGAIRKEMPDMLMPVIVCRGPLEELKKLGRIFEGISEKVS